MWLALWFALSSAPEVKLPPKRDVVPALTSSRPEYAEAIRSGVKTAMEKCDGGAGCFCRAIEKVRFDLALDGGTLTISYPLQGRGGPSFTLDSSGKVIDCRP